MFFNVNYPQNHVFRQLKPQEKAENNFEWNKDKNNYNIYCKDGEQIGLLKMDLLTIHDTMESYLEQVLKEQFQIDKYQEYGFYDPEDCIDF